MRSCGQTPNIAAQALYLLNKGLKVYLQRVYWTVDATVSEEGMIEGSMEDIDPSEWMVPEHCIPIHTNVTTYNWKPLQEAVQFDCIMMDPPWAVRDACHSPSHPR